MEAHASNDGADPEWDTLLGALPQLVETPAEEWPSKWDFPSIETPSKRDVSLGETPSTPFEYNSPLTETPGKREMERAQSPFQWNPALVGNPWADWADWADQFLYTKPQDLNLKEEDAQKREGEDVFEEDTMKEGGMDEEESDGNYIDDKDDLTSHKDDNETACPPHDICQGDHRKRKRSVTKHCDRRYTKRLNYHVKEVMRDAVKTALQYGETCCFATISERALLSDNATSSLTPQDYHAARECGRRFASREHKKLLRR